MNRRDITSLFSLDHVDHYELLKLFDVEFKTSWRYSTTEIAFPAQHDHLLLVRWDDDEIKAITKGRKLKQESIDRLIRLVQSNLIGQAPNEFGADVLLAGCPVPAGFRCDSIPLQILPPPDHAPRPPWISADHPFVLEFPLPRCELPELRFQRRSRRATEWARALNVFLPTRIQFQGPRIRQCWGMSIDEHHECRWVQQQYAYEPFNIFSPALSGGVPQLKSIPFSRTNSNIKAQFQAGRPIDELWIPNDLTPNLEAFAALQRRDRIRFLRAATAIYAANDAWETSVSSHLIACVQAIEALSEPVRSPPRRCRWHPFRKNPEPTAAFRAVCERYAPAELATKRVLNALYDLRSDIAHGRRFFYLDELPWSSGGSLSLLVSGDLDASNVVVQLATAVAINWMRDRTAAVAAL
jgi:hypothetical protein